MSCRKLEITLIAATGLDNVRLLGKMEVHARVTLGGDPRTKKRTPTHSWKDGPRLELHDEHMVRESSLENHGARIVIKLYCSRALGDRYIGEVNTSVREIYSYGKPSGGNAIVTYPVQRGAINSAGVLRFSYRFGEKISAEDVPVECIAI